MADPVVELEPVTAAVEPGGQARVVVTVVNEGSIVEGYRVDVLDDLTAAGRDVTGPASWAEVIPAEGTRSESADAPDLSVYPGQQGTVMVVFSPPVGTRVAGGHSAFAIRVRSLVDPDSSTVVEGDLEVGKVTALQAKMVPVTSTGRWSGKHVVELSNWGNIPAHLRVVAEDADRALGFLVQPETVELPVGASAPVRLKVRTRKPQLRGTVARLPFTVRAEPVGGVTTTPQVGLPQVTAISGAVSADTATVDGAFNQKPILTKGVVIGAGLLLVGIAGLTAYGLMQRGDPEETFAELGVPETPQMSVEAAGPESVRVGWSMIDRVQGYRLFTLDEQGVVSGTPMDLAPEVGATVVEGLEPEREYCFTMSAVRGEIQSPQSPPSCATTEPAVVEPTTEEPTTDPEETGGETSPGGETTDAEPTDAEPTDEAPPTDGETTDAGTDDPTGDPSDEPTTDSPTTDDPGETGPPVPPGAPVFEPGEWAAVLGVFPAHLAPGEFGANQLAEALQAAGVDAVVANSFELPNPEPFNAEAWLVLVGGFDTREEVAPACAALQSELPDLIQVCHGAIQPVRP